VIVDRHRRTRVRLSPTLVILPLVALSPLARPAPAGAEVRWRGDFETGDLSQWSFLLNKRGLTVVRGPVAEGRHACLVEITDQDLWPNGLNRVELQHKPAAPLTAEGAEGFYAWSFYLPAELGAGRHQLGYWESDKSYRQIMSLETEGRTIRFVTRLPADKVWWTGEDRLTRKRWHRIVMRVKWSRDPARGLVELWYDGEKVLRDAAARTIWDNPSFLQIGILRDRPGSKKQIVLDEVVAGTTLDDVAEARAAR
jgi:hypothetical protein